MPRFKYSAKTSDGRIVHSELLAEDFAKAQKVIVDSGMEVTSLNLVEATSWLEKKAIGFIEKRLPADAMSALAKSKNSINNVGSIRKPATEIQCGWCESMYAVPTNSPTCKNCGGPLPSVGEDRGQKPPPPVRQLPAAFPKRLRKGNANLKVGLVFMCVGVLFIPLFGFGLIFVGLGHWLWNKARKKIAGRLLALEHGLVTEGEITAVYVDSSVKINGRSPYKVEYQFRAHGNKVESGYKTTWNNSVLQHYVGEPQWVVYTPEDASQSDIWPPLA